MSPQIEEFNDGQSRALGGVDRRFAIKALAGASLPWIGAESASGFMANEVIRIACIGTGGRSRHLMERVLQFADAQIVAVCDVRDDNREAAAKMVNDAKRGSVDQEVDFRKLLERSDIDAVLIASPDHWHVPMTIAACEAGKDVYVEKPLTHSIAEGQSVIDAEANSGRIVQVGTQQRSMPHLIEARDIVRSGQLGEIHKIHMTWNRNQPRWDRGKDSFDPKTVRWDLFLGNAPEQEFDEYRMKAWRWFWDFGGGILTDLMVHWMDTAVWMMDLKAPTSARSLGNHYQAAGLWETPDTIQTLVDFAEDNVQAHFEGTFVNHNRRAHLMLMGSQANLICDRGGYEVVPERGSKVEARNRIDGANPLRGLDFYDDVDGAKYHLRNWLDCCRTRNRPSCTAADGVRSALPAHLGNLAYRENKVAVPTG